MPGEVRQFDLFAHPNPRLRSAFPFLVVVQADIADSDERLVAPLIPWGLARVRAGNRALPRVEHDGAAFAIALVLIGPLPVRLLRGYAGSVAAHRDDINHALDWIFLGL